MAESTVPMTEMGAALSKKNAARVASAMQFLRRLCDHASLIARAREFILGWLAAAVAAGHRGRAVGRAAGDLVELHLARKTVIEADDGHAEMHKIGEDEKQG